MADQNIAEGIPPGRCAHLSAGSSAEVARHDLSVLLLDVLIASIGLVHELDRLMTSTPQVQE